MIGSLSTGVLLYLERYVLVNDWFLEYRCTAVPGTGPAAPRLRQERAWTRPSDLLDPGLHAGTHSPPHTLHNVSYTHSVLYIMPDRVLFVMFLRICCNLVARNII